MLNPFATMFEIAEESDGCVAHEDMNFVQEPQSKGHDMDRLLMSNIVVAQDDAPLHVELAVSILTDTMFTSADIQDQLERDDTGQSCDLSASGFRILIVDYHFEDRIYFHQPSNVYVR